MKTEGRDVYDLEGRELDLAVHEEVLGQPGCAVREDDGDFVRWRPVDSEEAAEHPEDRRQIACRLFHRNMAAAWKVAEHLRQRGFLPVLKHMPDDHPFKAQGSASEYAGPGDRTRDLGGTEGRAIAEFYPVSDEARESVDVLADMTAYGNEPAEAICRAAILTVREVGDEG